MLFPVKIKRYLIYKSVDFALFISIRKIILTTNNAINYKIYDKHVSTFIGYRVRNDESKAFNVCPFFTKILFSKLLKILLFFTYTSINNPKNVMRVTKTFSYKGNLL